MDTTFQPNLRTQAIKTLSLGKAFFLKAQVDWCDQDFMIETVSNKFTNIQIEISINERIHYEKDRVIVVREVLFLILAITVNTYIQVNLTD